MSTPSCIALHLPAKFPGIKKLLSLLLLCSTLACFAQDPITNVNISMPASPDANTANWGLGASPFTISAKAMLDSNRQVTAAVAESRILITIKKAGSKVCGSYTSSTAPYSSFNNAVQVWNGRSAVSLMGQDCVLPPGDYQLCVQFFGVYNGAAKAFSVERCKPFTIKGASATDDIVYQQPQNVLPGDGTVLKETDAKKPITFRWVPVVPKPKGNVLYKVKVFEVKKGQSATEAMRINSLLSEQQTTNQTQLSCCINPIVVWPIAQDSKYGWYVEASDGNGKGYGNSEPTSFIGESPCSPTYDFYKDEMYCGPDGKVHVNGHVTITPKSSITINQILLTQIKETDYNGANISTTTTVFPTSLIKVGNNYFFQFIINNPMCGKDLYIGYDIDYSCSTTGRRDTIPCGEVIKNIPCCRCTTCEDIAFNLNQETTQFNPWGPHSSWFSDNNHLYLTQPLAVSPSTIKVVQVKAEVADFYWYTEKADCKKCTNNSYYWGNIITGNTNNTGFNPAGTSGTDDAGVPLPNSHEMQFISSTATGASFNGNIRLQLSLPPQTELSCCTDCFRFCIRYSIVFIENGVCKTCTKLKCYEVKRQHRQSIFTMYPPPNECGDPGVIIRHGAGTLMQQK